jgi:hypothetical protein
VHMEYEKRLVWEVQPVGKKLAAVDRVQVLSAVLEFVCCTVDRFVILSNLLVLLVLLA